MSITIRHRNTKHIRSLIDGLLTRTVLLAGLALKTHGSLVKALILLRAGLVNFFLSFMFSTPSNSKLPVLFSSLAANSTSMTVLTCLGFNSVLYVTAAKAQVAVKPALAFMAFTAFSARAMVVERCKGCNHKD